MKCLFSFACSSLTTLCILAAIGTTIPSNAQNIWTNGAYSVSTVIENENTGIGVIATISGNAGNGYVYGYGSGTDAEDWGIGWAKAEFAVTYTWHGSGSPTTLTLKARGDVSGSVSVVSGSASGEAGVETDSAGALNYYQTAAPDFTYSALGLPTMFTSSPFTLYIIGSGEGIYSGHAMGVASSTVYFIRP